MRHESFATLVKDIQYSISLEEGDIRMFLTLQCHKQKLANTTILQYQVETLCHTI